MTRENTCLQIAFATLNYGCMLSDYMKQITINVSLTVYLCGHDLNCAPMKLSFP